MAWAPNYSTEDALKTYLRIDTADTQDDNEVALALAASSRAIDRYTNRQFGAVDQAEERYYEGRWDHDRNRWVVELDDLSTPFQFVVVDGDGNTIPAEATSGDGGYVLEPRNAPQLDRPWTQFVLPQTSNSEFYCTGVWGWPSIPDAVQQACLLQSARLFARRGAPFGVAGSPDMGSEVRLLAKLDVDVEVVLGPYKRWWAAR